MCVKDRWGGRVAERGNKRGEINAGGILNHNLLIMTQPLSYRIVC